MAISIHKLLESDTIHVPEAADLVGKEVRITIVEEPLPKPKNDLSDLRRIAGKIDMDWDAVEDLRRRSMI